MVQVANYKTDFVDWPPFPPLIIQHCTNKGVQRVKINPGDIERNYTST